MAEPYCLLKEDAAMNSTLLPLPPPIEMFLPEPTPARLQIYAIVLEKTFNETVEKTVLRVTPNVEYGKQWVDKMNRQAASLRQKRHLLTMAKLSWRQENPMPSISIPTMLHVPVIPNDRQATPQEREEKHRVNNDNLLRSLAAREPQRQWVRQEEIFELAWLAEHLTEEETALNEFPGDQAWSIEPVPWLD